MAAPHANVWPDGDPDFEAVLMEAARELVAFDSTSEREAMRRVVLHLLVLNRSLGVCDKLSLMDSMMRFFMCREL